MNKPRRMPVDSPDPLWSMNAVKAIADNDLEEFKTLLLRDDKALLDSAATVKDGKALLHVAANRRRLKFVEALLRAGADPDIRTSYEETPLHFAAAKGDLGIIAALAGAKADLDARDRRDRTPFLIAAQNGRTEAAIALKQAGADIFAVDMSGWTAIHFAAIKDYDGDIFDALQKMGLDANQRDDISWTALHWVAESGQAGPARALLRIGADPQIISDDDLDAMDMATRKNNQDVLMVLREHASLNHSHRLKRLSRMRPALRP